MIFSGGATALKENPARDFVWTNPDDFLWWCNGLEEGLRDASRRGLDPCLLHLSRKSVIRARHPPAGARRIEYGPEASDGVEPFTSCDREMGGAGKTVVEIRQLPERQQDQRQPALSDRAPIPPKLAGYCSHGPPKEASLSFVRVRSSGG